MLFRKNKRNQPSEADVKAIEERVRAARERITSRRPGEPGRGPTPGAMRSLAQAAAAGEPVMPSQVPTLTPSGPTPPAAAAPSHVPPARVLPGDIPTYLKAKQPLPSASSTAPEQQRVLPSQIPSSQPDPEPEAFSFPVPPASWERS